MHRLFKYVQTLERVVSEAHVTDRDGRAAELGAAVETMGRAMRAAHGHGNKVMFIGNGGSAGICSHMAIDYSKNGGIRSTAFNDSAALTCLGNDLGYEHVFAKQVDLHAREGDVLVAISSSGRSRNILNAADAGRARGCTVYTLSGFDRDNPLRAKGDLNVYLSSHEYGFVEVGHLAILHAVLDLEMGWAAEPAAANREVAK